MIPTTPTSASAQARIADSLLRSLGGRQVLLHIPAPAMNGDLGEQLGLAQPAFQDVQLGPVAFRRLRSKTGSAQKPADTEYELMVSASAVAALVGSLSYQAADVLFAQTAAVLVDDNVMNITWVASAEAFGSVYLYRLGLRGALKSIL